MKPDRNQQTKGSPTSTKETQILPPAFANLTLYHSEPPKVLQSHISMSHDIWDIGLSTMNFHNVLNHITLTHPALGANAITSSLWTLEWRWMILLEMVC
jgi:hypothetical protein